MVQARDSDAEMLMYTAMQLYQDKIDSGAEAKSTQLSVAFSIARALVFYLNDSSLDYQTQIRIAAAPSGSIIPKLISKKNVDKEVKEKAKSVVMDLASLVSFLKKGDDQSVKKT